MINVGHPDGPPRLVRPPPACLEFLARWWIDGWMDGEGGLMTGCCDTDYVRQGVAGFRLEPRYVATVSRTRPPFRLPWPMSLGFGLGGGGLTQVDAHTTSPSLAIPCHFLPFYNPPSPPPSFTLPFLHHHTSPTNSSNKQTSSSPPTPTPTPTPTTAPTPPTTPTSSGEKTPYTRSCSQTRSWRTCSRDSLKTKRYMERKFGDK